MGRNMRKAKVKININININPIDCYEFQFLSRPVLSCLHKNENVLVHEWAGDL